jgi:site-specific DNA recombinase
LYVEHRSLLGQRSLLSTIAELDRRGWTTKKWTTKKGKQRGGRPFNKNTLCGLLTNVAYVGKVRYRDEIYEGQHEAVVDAKIFERVQRLLHRNHRTGGTRVPNRFGALLMGMLHCVPCGCRMTPAQTTNNGGKRYRYYVCINAQKRGWHNCPSKSIPATEIERFVVDQVKGVAADPGLIADTLTATRQQIEKTLDALDVERQGVQEDLVWADAEVRALLGDASSGHATARLADLRDRGRLSEQHLTEIREEEYRLRDELVDENDVADVLRDFESHWESFSPDQQVRMIKLLIERVDYDPAENTVSVTFRPTGITGVKSLAEQMTEGDAA